MLGTIYDRLDARCALGAPADDLPVTLDEWVLLAEYLFAETADHMIRDRHCIPYVFQDRKLVLVEEIP
jgi:hypothetical protein